MKARLVALRGIGEWTAEWFLARHLARPRAWPAGDLALRKAVAHFYGDADVRAVRRAARPVPEPLGALPARRALRWRRIVNVRAAHTRGHRSAHVARRAARVRAACASLCGGSRGARARQGRGHGARRRRARRRGRRTGGRIRARPVRRSRPDDGLRVGSLGRRGGTRRGLGRELLRRISEAAAARGTTHVLLDVDSRNSDALTFYRRLGFEEGAKILRAPLDAALAQEHEPRRERRRRPRAERRRRGGRARRRATTCRGSCAARPEVERGETWTVVRIEPFDATCCGSSAWSSRIGSA